MRCSNQARLRTHSAKPPALSRALAHALSNRQVSSENHKDVCLEPARRFVFHIGQHVSAPMAMIVAVVVHRTHRLVCLAGRGVISASSCDKHGHVSPHIESQASGTFRFVHTPLHFSNGKANCVQSPRGPSKVCQMAPRCAQRIARGSALLDQSAPHLSINLTADSS
jgi:hypothetical protein